MMGNGMGNLHPASTGSAEAVSGRDGAALMHEAQRIVNEHWRPWIGPGGYGSAVKAVMAVLNERQSNRRTLEMYRQFHDAWVEHQVSLATGSPELEAKHHAKMLALHRQCNAHARESAPTIEGSATP